MKLIIEGADYFIRMIPLPGSVGGMVMPNDDGTFSLYLNSNHNSEMNLADWEHEVEHIENDDFYSGKSIREIEGWSA